MKRHSFHLMLGCGLLLIPLPAPGQTYSIDRFVIGSGGGASAGGNFAVTGTLGQPEATAQPLIGGPFSLSGGFWALSAVQTSGAPFLSIARLGEGAQISWPVTAAGFVLDQSATVMGTWSPVSFSPQTNGSTISLHVPLTPGSRYYRLRKL